MRRFHCFASLAILVGLVCLPECYVRGQPRTRQAPPAARPETAPAAPVEPLRMAGDRPIDIQHIRLDLRVDLPKKTVDAKATIQFRTLRPIAAITLDAGAFEVLKVAMVSEGQEGGPLHFSHDEKKLVIDLDSLWPRERAGTLVIDYRVREPQDGLHFFGPTSAEPDVPLTVWSQGEPVSNRDWFPCFDHTNQRQTTELIVTVAQGFEVLSNGKLVERRSNPDGKTATFHWRQDKPHAAYLVTLVVGQFDIVEEEWNHIPLLYWVPKGHKGDVARTFGRTKEMLDLFTKRFGIAYPWDKYAQVVVEQFSAGGMENTSATTLNDRALHDERAMLDHTPDGLISHELAHQWWGDLVTCKDWAHVWLNEGFASYAEVIWAEYHDGPEEAAYNLLSKAQFAMSRGKDRPVVDRRYPSPGAMFDARAYPKGAWVLHMLRRQLGDDVFWKCLQRYGNEFRLQCADTDDFRKVLERETGRSLERFFYDWTERPGHPVLEIDEEYLPQAKQARIRVKQTQAGEAFHFPLKIAFQLNGNGTSVISDHEITEKEQTLYTSLSSRPNLVMIDPDQTLLAEIKETKSRELWIQQLAKADVAGKVRAAEHLGQSKSPMDQEALANALVEEKFWGVQAEVAKALGESGGNRCRDTLVQGLKHSHPKVRRACAEQLAKFPRDSVAAGALRALLEKGDPSYFVEAAAIGTYGKLQQPDTIAVLSPRLNQSSYHEVIRVAALAGLGDSQDLAALEPLTAWTQQGKPRECRAAALLALAHLAQTTSPSDEQQRRIHKTVSSCLEGENPWVLRGAITALRDLGRSASPALPALEAISRHDPDDRLRDLAKRAIEQIRGNSPVPVEVTRLREEVESLKKAQDALKQQLEKNQSKEQKGPVKASGN